MPAPFTRAPGGRSPGRGAPALAARQRVGRKGPASRSHCSLEVCRACLAFACDTRSVETCAPTVAALCRVAAEMRPDSNVPLNNMANSYLGLEQLDDALREAREAFRRKADYMTAVTCELVQERACSWLGARCPCPGPRQWLSELASVACFRWQCRMCTRRRSSTGKPRACFLRVLPPPSRARRRTKSPSGLARRNPTSCSLLAAFGECLDGMRGARPAARCQQGRLTRAGARLGVWSGRLLPCIGIKVITSSFSSMRIWA